VVDDLPGIHRDYDRILASGAPSDVSELETELFGEDTVALPTPTYAIDHAYSGAEAIELVREAVARRLPYAVAFLDVRMPPGIDGIETAVELLRLDPRLQIVICSAYTDYSWEQVREALGVTHNLLVLRKPFDSMEIAQSALTLAEKRRMLDSLHTLLDRLERSNATEPPERLAEIVRLMRHALESTAFGA
jgi:CheY-like chemotaxis protein